ncbi:hypothetical protein RHMOL_Rhmol06G0192300 [Rhododendron molle]|uniref:Uncharacterized protein n=1 Tax=Rhododendron molle TaxID=49168 RepID=A0ACC0NDT4_RHOML|nr:hypothetical protein RHMOL_Rhmol06G0192300 [Rhododendron molle]
MLKWFSQVIYSSPPLKVAREVISKVAFVAWNIWKSRNDFVFILLWISSMGCVLARDLDLLNVEIDSDCKQAISLSVSELVPLWEVLALVLDIRKLA